MNNEQPNGSAVTSGEDDAMRTATGHEVGATYRSFYWGQTYTVVRAIDTNHGQYIVAVWSDGSTTTHCTSRGSDELVTA